MKVGSSDLLSTIPPRKEVIMTSPVNDVGSSALTCNAFGKSINPSVYKGQILSAQSMRQNAIPTGEASNTAIYKKLKSLIISQERGNSYRHLNDILNEIISQNKDFELFQDLVKEKGGFHVDILDSKEINAFVEFESNNIYITSAMLRYLEEKYDKHVNDALAFVISHEIGHKFELKLRPSLDENFLNEDNTWVEDFADKSACQLMHRAGFDLEPILDFFSILSGTRLENDRAKPIPFLMTHPHNSDRDLFIRQCYESIYSRQEGEYVSDLSNHKLTPQIQNENELQGKYNFLDSISALKTEDCNTIEKGLLKALSLLKKFREDEGRQINYDTDSERAVYKKHIDLCFDAVEEACGASGFTISLLRDILEHEVNLVGKSQRPSLDLADKYRYLPQQEVIAKLTAFLEEIPSSLELEMQNCTDTYYLHSAINKAFIDISNNVSTVSSSLVPATLNLMDLIHQHEYFGPFGDQRYYCTWFEFEDKNELVNKIEVLIQSDQLELVKFIVSNINYKFRPDDSDLIFSVTCDPVAEMSNEELLISVLDRDYRLSESERHISRERLFDEYFDRLIKESSAIEMHQKFLNSIDEIYDVIKSNQGSRLSDKQKHPERFLKSMAQQYLDSSIMIGRDMSLDLILEAAKISGSIVIPEEQVRTLMNYEDINKYAELVLLRQEAEFVPNHNVSGLNNLCYEEKVYKRDNQYVFRRRVEELIKERSLIGLGDGANFLPDVKIEELGYQFSTKLNVLIGDHNSSHGLEEFKDYLLKVMNVNSLLEEDSVFKAILLTADKEQQIALVELLKDEIGIDEKVLDEFAVFLHKDLRVRMNLNDEELRPSLLESIGLSYDDTNLSFKSFKSHSISPREYLYLQFFKNELNIFKEKTVSEMLTWFEKHWNEKSPYRDVILNQLFTDKNSVFVRLDKKTQQHIMSLYESDFKLVTLKENHLEQCLSLCSSLDEKVALIDEVLPEPSKERDARLERVFLESGFALDDYNKYSDMFLENSIEAFKKDRVAMHGFGAIFNIFFAKDNKGLKDARETAIWLIKDGVEVPSKVANYFKYLNTSPQLMKDFFNDYESLRNSVIQEAFVGDNGFFSHPDELNKLLDSLFDKSLEHEEGKAKVVNDRNKLKTLVREALYRVFDSSNETKKLAIMNRMISKLSETPELEIEDLIQVLLSSYGTVGVKLAQILSSQSEIKERFPELYSKLEELKDANAPIPISEIFDAIKSNPNLQSKDIKILKLLGSASVKCVYLVEIDGEEAVLKVRRKRADKSLIQETNDFEYLVNTLNPILEKEFGISNIPNYSERIFADIKEEVDLIVEAKNMLEMKKIVDDFNHAEYSNVTFGVSEIKEELSNGIIMVEGLAPGIPLKNFREESNSEIIDIVEKEVARFTAYCADKFIHVDPHDGNLFIKQSDEGEIMISLIDLGLAQKLPAMPKTLNNLISDDEFWNIVNLLDVKDFKLLSQISEYVSIESLLDDGKLSWNILNNMWKSSFNNKFQAALKFQIDPLQISKTLNKFAKLKNKLSEHGCDQDLKYLFQLIGTDTGKNIIQCSQNKGIKEISLILLNQLDQSQSFKVNQELWRSLLSVSKNPYVIERIKSDPSLLKVITQPNQI